MNITNTSIKVMRETIRVETHPDNETSMATNFKRVISLPPDEANVLCRMLLVHISELEKVISQNAIYTHLVTTANNKD